MTSLRGIFPEPKKEPKKNFIKENVRQLKLLQEKPAEPKFATKSRQRASVYGPGVKATFSEKSGKLALTTAKSSSSSTKKKTQNGVRIKKGDMSEFLRRKEKLHMKKDGQQSDEDRESDEPLGTVRDVACQTIESSLPQRFDESTKITTLYAKKDEDEAKLKASGDSERHYRSTKSSPNPQRRAVEELADYERPHSRLNSILERKHEQQKKDPYLPSGYQKGVLPKYLRERKETVVKEAEGVNEGADCPSGHVPLPDAERKETLRMLRTSFAELVSELNKMPVKTDTLRMRNRKMELEKQLAKLEEGIKVFSRPKVFVKIGE